MRVRELRQLALIAIIPLLIIGCNEDDANTSVEDEPFTGSPTALAARSEDTEQVNLIIEEAQFDTDGIDLQEDESTIILVSNQDSVSYIFRIEGLVNDMPVPANQETKIEFTQPNEGTYEAELVPETGGDAIDTLDVEVAPPEGGAP